MKLWPASRAHRQVRPSRSTAALSLIEVMIAMGIFFMVVFAILGMVSSTLRNARALQERHVDAGALAAFLTLSNRLDEGTYSGDFGDLFPDHEYEFEVISITNTLVRVDLTVRGDSGKRREESSMSILLFLPNQPAGGVPGFGPRR
jgi:Tfp pilus assembly protein PilV